MRTRESMKRKRINVALILHGPGTSQPMVQWRFLFILSFVILVSSPCSDSRVCTRKILSFKWSIVKDQDRSIIRPFQCHNCTEWHTGNGSVAHFARSRCNQREAKESTGEKTRKNNSFGSCMRNLCWCNFECAARNPSSIQKIAKTLKSNKDEISANYIDDGWRGGNLLGSQDQESWGSVSMQKKNIHTQELPFVNITHNGTEDYQLVVHNEETLSHKRIKRGVIHLYNMLVCATGCNPLSYKGYGCYCGFLGSGYVIDGIDRCCKMHDWCYDATDCPMFSEYFVPYYWRCYHGYKPVCAVEHGNWGGSGSCAQRLCECDRSFAECLKRYPCPTTKAVCTSSPWRLVQNLFMTM